jgi:transposase
MKSHDLPADVEALRALLLAERRERDAERKAHEQELASAARRERELAQQQAIELSATIEQQRATIEKYERRILELLASLRGKQRERIDPDQLLMFDLGELESFVEEQAEEQEQPPTKQRSRPHGRQLIPDHLPCEEVVHELPEDERLCPHDGRPMPLIRYEESRQLEYEPARFKVIVHKRAVYGCPEKHDEATLLTASKPPQPIEKGLAGPGLLAAVSVGKFGDHLPGYRLEDIFQRHGVPIRRSTIYDWLSAAADLVRPLVERMQELLLQSRVIHTDDTQVKLIDLATHGTRLARFWAYVGDASHPYTVYDFTETRKRDGPEQFLAGYRGYLQADAYGGYDGVYLDSDGAIIEVACWAHCRRYWWKARDNDSPRAHYVLAVIGRLYDLERQARDADTVERLALRRTEAAPLLDGLKRWLDEQQLLPKSPIGEAARYTRNQWDALQRYLEDGELSIDNNLSERTVKPIAIGRKNWLFVGSKQAGSRAAWLLSLIASCKANRVEPWAYLRDVFTRLPTAVPLDELLPDRWLTANPQHRWTIADHRAQERAAKGRL